MSNYTLSLTRIGRGDQLRPCKCVACKYLSIATPIKGFLELSCLIMNLPNGSYLAPTLAPLPLKGE